MGVDEVVLVFEIEHLSSHEARFATGEHAADVGEAGRFREFTQIVFRQRRQVLSVAEDEIRQAVADAVAQLGYVENSTEFAWPI